MDTPIRVLHVDDNPDILDLTATFLQREDERFEVGTAEGVSEGMDSLEEDQFDCVVSDYDMPGTDGIEFLDEVRDTYPDLPFILYTGKGSEEVASKAISTGVTDYLQKESGTSHFEILANRIKNSVNQRRSEQKVAQIENRLQTIVENTKDILWKFSADWSELLFINPPFEDIWGGSMADLRERPESLLDGVHPDDRPAVREAMDQLSAGESVDFECRVNADEDFGRWVWIQGEPVFDDTGDVDAVVGFARDVTERKERENELRKLKGEYKTVFDTAQDAIFLFDVEQRDGEDNFRLRNLNTAHEETSGLSLDEDRGKTPVELLGEKEGSQVTDNYRRCVESQEPISYEEVLEMPSGNVFWQTKLAPVVQDDDVVQLVGVARDITERKEYEQELERKQAYLERTRDAISVIDPDGIIRYESPAIAEVLGYNPDERVGENGFEYIHPEDRETAIEYFQQPYDGGAQTGPVELRHRHKDGSWRWIDSRGSFHLDHPAIEGVVASMRDVTERRRRENQLETLREQTEFVLAETDTIVWTWNPETGEATTLYRELEDFIEIDSSNLEGLEGFMSHVVHPEDRSDLMDSYEQVLQGESDRINGEFRTAPGLGQERWFVATAYLRTNGDSQQLVGLMTDITDRKQHEQRLATLHETTRRLIDADSKYEVADIAVEAAHELLEFSLPSVWYATEDRTELALVANTDDHQALLEEADMPNPAHSRDSWLWQVFETGDTTVRSPVSSDELAADVPLQSAIILPLGDHGILSCAAKSETEFTDRQIRVAEILERSVRVALDQLEQREAIERQKEFTEDLLDSVEDIVYVLDTDGDLRDWNVAFEEVSAYESAEIESMNATDFFSASDTSRAAAAVLETFETGQTRVELDFQTADGELIPYEFIAKAFEAPDGDVVIAGIGRDQSLHVEYEQRLEEQRDSLDVLNSVVRHDIRNHMTVVRGRAELLEKHIDDGGKESLEALYKASENAIQLTKTARDLAETMLSTEGDLKPVKLAAHLEEPIETVRSSYDNAVITIDDGIPDIHVQGNDLLDAVFRNILHNAVVHNDSTIPEVQVSLAMEGESVRVSIADNGPGIPEEINGEIFGKGEKGLESPGTGVGLYLVRMLVDQYGGDVWVEDNEPEGTVFHVELSRVGGDSW